MSDLLIAKCTPYFSKDSIKQTLGIFHKWLQANPDTILHRINVAQFSDELNVSKDDLLSVFLVAVLEGYMGLRWDFHCPHCHGLASFHSHLSKSKTEDYCGLCQVGFANTLDETIEVTFTASAQLRMLPSGYEENFMQDMVAQIKAGTWKMPEKYTSGLDCLHNEIFQKYFSEDVLSIEESLEVKSITLLFTDIKGSTPLYDSLGDAKAYKLVRDHFAYLFTAVEKQHGVIVKTIGDAVMASFQRQVDALNAVLDIFKEIQKIRIPQIEKPIEVKFGIHTGPAIVVNLNNRLDYFGQNVNMAARIQDLAKGHQLFISEKVWQDPQIQAALADKKVTRYAVQLKGIKERQIVYALEEM